MEYSLLSMVLRQRDIHVQKNEVGPLLHTMFKVQLKMNHRPNFKN